MSLGIQRRISSIRGQQSLVLSDLDDLPLCHNNDDVGVSDGRQSGTSSGCVITANLCATMIVVRPFEARSMASCTSFSLRMSNALVALDAEKRAALLALAPHQGVTP